MKLQHNTKDDIMQTEKRLTELGLTLPGTPKAAGTYVLVKEFCCNMAYVSGCLPIIDGENITGKLGADCSLENGIKAAERCTLNILSALKAHIGDLDRIKSCVKMTVLVASTPEFYQHPQVANAATELLVKIMGDEKGKPTRAAFGASSLPLNSAVEVELMVELEKS